ncbi:hypothetical protein P43SY_005920 [Pythium insidiosum]|uniref:Matrin-type domain-containing protein n=1 Tax=Pythium insidiosum TaxID=114742 RepID=A0AAD5LJA3_PYTIN|nr:hypothetical protein P43SY_005920 [Pythium insidiosum]
MVDYWVSRERHYCKFCNVWMQSDKASIRHHEQGGRHKQNVDAALKAKRRDKSDAAAAERELAQQLREIERAAHAKFATDVATGSSSAVSSAGGAVLPPPPPPRRSRPSAPVAQQRRDDAPPPLPAFNGEEDGGEPVKEDDKGIYAVRGVVYLDGKRHETQLITGSACQIWSDEHDEWIDALVENAVVQRIPNTDRSFARYVITYMAPGATEPVTEQDVRSDRLRIALPAGVTLEDAERLLQKVDAGDAETVMQAHIPIDESTGMGEWSTVVVREIDESAEAIARREEEAAREEATRVKQEQQREGLEDFSGQGDNALGAFNPWGGSYKGIELDKETAKSRQAREEEIMIQTNGNVAFKKRCKAETSDDANGAFKSAKKAKKQRRIRTDDDE